MGIDIDLVIGNVGEYLKCSICRDLIEDPVTITACGDIFCKSCLEPVITGKVIEIAVNS